MEIEAFTPYTRKINCTSKKQNRMLVRFIDWNFKERRVSVEATKSGSILDDQVCRTLQ